MDFDFETIILNLKPLIDEAHLAGIVFVRNEADAWGYSMKIRGINKFYKNRVGFEDNLKFGMGLAIL